VVVGAGIVGLATARALLEREPGLRLCVIERHGVPAAGQSGHNSGVIHSGIYYKPGSHKARLCREGRARLLEYCATMGIEHRVCGKILVATDEAAVGRLESLVQRGRENGLAGLEWLEADRIRDVEPHAAGLAALHVPEAGVVDFGEVCARLHEELAGRGVDFQFGTTLEAAAPASGGVEIETARERLSAGRLVACAGLYADEVARRSGLDPRARIVPFRGEYWIVSEEAAGRVEALIYPVPDPELPFLGVHLTRDVHGTVDAGPNAVPAFAREGYTRRDVDLRHLAGLALWPGAWRLAWRQRRYVGGEMVRSLSRHRTAERLRLMLPSLRDEHLLAGRSGVRAQLVDPDGRLVDDFRFAGDGPMLHVLNAPSPAATAALAIGAHVADRALDD
jgi:L-2-hydroxyglutarate oxidase